MLARSSGSGMDACFRGKSGGWSAKSSARLALPGEGGQAEVCFGAGLAPFAIIYMLRSEMATAVSHLFQVPALYQTLRVNVAKRYPCFRPCPIRALLRRCHTSTGHDFSSRSMVEFEGTANVLLTHNPPNLFLFEDYRPSVLLAATWRCCRHSFACVV